LLDRIFCKCG